MFFPDEVASFYTIKVPALSGKSCFLLYGELCVGVYFWVLYGLINSSVAHAGRGVLRPNRQTLYRYSRLLFRSTGLTLVIMPTFPTDDGRILFITITTASPSLYLLCFMLFVVFVC